jgi:intergrase/recombinase
VDPYRRAWQLAKVPPEVWDVTDEERGHGSPSHAIRRCVRTELIRLGVQESVVLHLIGHAAGHTAAAYVPVSSPEQSPWWPLLVAAMRKIPPHS